MASSDVAFLKHIADDTRWSILSLLRDRERCVCEIFPAVGRTQSTVSIHLTRLERAGLVKSERRGHKMFYRISDERVLRVFTALGERSRTKVTR